MTQNTMPRVAVISAMTRARVIGLAGGLPWHLPEDLQLFKALTMGNSVMMGRKTFATIGHPLAGRHNIVLSRTLKEAPGVEVCDGFMRGLAAAARIGKPVFVIGGAELYRKALPLAEALHISWIEEEHPGDVFFPTVAFEEWQACDEKHFQGFHYVHYRRIVK